jgi:hypothetical protein
MLVGANHERQDDNTDTHEVCYMTWDCNRNIDSYAAKRRVQGDNAGETKITTCEEKGKSNRKTQSRQSWSRRLGEPSGHKGIIKKQI